MARGACALALLCAIVAGAAAYTVDCNHEYADCDTELSKLTSEDDEPVSTLPPIVPTVVEVSPETTSTTIAPTRSTPTTERTAENKTEVQTTEANEVKESVAKPKPRLLNLNVDELQNFANILHNQTKGIKNTFADLSDVNLDEDEDEENPRLKDNDPRNSHIPDKFYTNLKAPFNPLLTVDRSEEIETCKESGITYKIGEHIDRGCEETCECTPSGTFECAPRCKHPYIRRGRRLTDPLCFESPVDECCSIIACATGNGDPKLSTLEVCRYGNVTYPVGGKWNIGCDQTCTCEQNSVVTCKPRCKRLPQSDKCINVQDPHDECCEMQICDVSQDVHEEPAENITSSTSSTTDMPQMLEDLINLPMSPMRPLVLIEPIGSIKVLQNNSVQVNLMHMNSSDDPIHLELSSDGGKTYSDVELKYANLILNLEGGKDYVLKTKETGTKFNFTITASDVGNEVPEESMNGTKVGCYHDGQFYEIGDEFQIGCSELCECTGPDSRECAPLLCPSHVGLELVSKGCVRWAQNPPPTPPNCCPRTARCLSDGTCHYKGVAIPNWSEVPLELTGCEEHCFCENGELDCEEACAPLPPIPPQNLRCPPMHRPAPVNISDEDCCKQWGCIPHAGNMNASTSKTYSMPTHVRTMMNYVTPVIPVIPTVTTSYLPTPSQSNEFYNRLSPIKSNLPVFFKTVIPQTGHNDTITYLTDKMPNHIMGDNITVFTPEDVDSPFKTIHPEPPLVTNNVDWDTASHSKSPILSNHFKNSQLNSPISMSNINSEQHKPLNIIISDGKLHDVIQNFKDGNGGKINILNSHDSFVKQINENPSGKKVPLLQIDNLNYFLPAYHKEQTKNSGFIQNDPHKTPQTYFEPKIQIVNKITDHSILKDLPKLISNQNDHLNHVIHNSPEKHITVMRIKDLKTAGTSDFKSTPWRKNMEKHLLTKEPNPYETVLLRVPNAKTEIKPTFIPTSKDIPRVPIKTYSSLDLEHLLNQMELESEVNRNLGRSADKSRGTIALGQLPPGFPAKPPQVPQFLPTVPPNNRYPPDDGVDYEQNNIHRPLNPLEPPINGLPPGLPIPGYGDENKKLSVLSLQSDSPTSIKMLFGLPPVLVGLRGSVDLRYTDSADEDISQWYSQVFAPADEVLTTPRLEFRLTGLKSSTTYKIRGKLYLHNLPVEPESEIYTVKTQDLPTVLPPEEKRREIDCKLTVVDVNDTTAHVSWRHFTEDELQFIDGIQVRYRPTGTPIYSMTELLHHSRSAAELRELRPGSRYEASLVLIPPPRATTELHDPGQVEFTTAPYIDPYNWSVTLEARAVGASALELEWRGVPPPAERWVRVVRAAHACGPRAAEHDAFRLAARDSPPSMTLSGLTPDTKCRVWLELFLTNGKVKTSNVLEIHTKSLDSSEPIDNVIEASSVAGSRARGDYYGALVVAGVLAALGALASLLLLLVVLRRHRPRSVAITSVPSAPRESSLPPYDNPAYKLELQQETMDL